MNRVAKGGVCVYERVQAGNDWAFFVVTNLVYLFSFLSVVNVRIDLVNIHKQCLINYFGLKIVT